METKNILIEGKYNKDDESINLDEGIEDKEGSNWRKKYEIEGVNILNFDKKEEKAIIRVTLKKINQLQEMIDEIKEVRKATNCDECGRYPLDGDNLKDGLCKSCRKKKGKYIKLDKIR